ncbi:MAG: NAD(P)-dependent oxidoreductase [Microbacterium sp.]|uniref:NAD-dependent epimerase/dehydratase family protein n=1 Tax=Microbacterium sp. TaxID=51671 RepID=UPI001AC2D29A|nr:NAD(P)-dependent oxidoreductase [Microbacterium sp.]MBN9155776.1 NAD(P)-dependent oxidoreductase [Microbacterium sp.]
MASTSRSALITGAGMLGAHTARRLIDAGWHVTVVDRALQRDYLSDVLESDGVTLVEGDLLDDELLEALPVPDLVVHTAALIAARAQADPLLAVDVNVRATTRLALWAARGGASRFVAISTWGVHDMDAPGRLTVDAPLAPQHTSYYGATKMAMEEILGAVASATRMRVVIFRPTVMYGYGPHLGGALGSFAVEAAVLTAMNGAPTVLPGNLLARTEMLYVDDAAAAIVAAATLEEPTGFARYLLGPQETTTADELAAALARIFPDVPIRVDEGEGTMSPPSRDEPTDIAATIAALGIDPPRTLEDGFLEFVRVLRAARSRQSPPA